MDTIAETANFDYHSSFADQGKRTSVFRFPYVVQTEIVVCPFVYEETNGSYPFANGLNGLNRLVRL
jgi:hypothetical protein